MLYENVVCVYRLLLLLLFWYFGIFEFLNNKWCIPIEEDTSLMFAWKIQYISLLWIEFEEMDAKYCTPIDHNQ
jgi:hypothetical protein